MNLSIKMLSARSYQFNNERKKNLHRDDINKTNKNDTEKGKKNAEIAFEETPF